MEVKGTAYLARQAYIVAQFGQERWNAFLDEFWVARGEPPLRVVAVTTIPAETFLALNDAIVDRFYDGRIDVHAEFGRASAEWALREGPYKNFFRSNDVPGFLTTAPVLWRAYYSEGEFIATLDGAGAIVDARIVNLPIAHVHFEYNVMAYLHRGLELIGATVLATEILRGFSKGDDDVHYRFRLAP